MDKAHAFPAVAVVVSGWLEVPFFVVIGSQLDHAFPVQVNLKDRV